jgi:hypothetical protein
MTIPSKEQDSVINAPVAPMSVIACAGSGKTYTAVRRLAQMRRALPSERGRVALLSFSNVAVDTFRREYAQLMQAEPAGGGGERVEIATLDGFITTHLLNPHAHRIMRSTRSAFFVTGNEAFLAGFTFQTARYPRPISDLQVGTNATGAYFYYRDNDAVVAMDQVVAKRLVERFGRTGAYTHELGRYWCHRLLAEEPALLRALVRRYPHILIDEAQDIGTLHQAILEQLIAVGCQVSLIGDPHQGIYEFAGANGAFLAAYEQRHGVQRRSLSVNYRATPPLVTLAKTLGKRQETPDRTAPETVHGAFFVPYRRSELANLITAFEHAVVDAGLDVRRSAVLCRGRELADKLGGRTGAPGQGLVRTFAQAAIQRDRFDDYHGAFKLGLRAIVGLIDDAPEGLANRVILATEPEERAIRRLVWAFIREPDTGLPQSSCPASTQWHPLLIARIKVLLTELATNHGLHPVANLGLKLAKRELTVAPILVAADLTHAENSTRIRVDTVHQAKGESLDAVLYVAARDHVDALLAGVNTELGRIGYVAATRARNLFWLGVPATGVSDLRESLTKLNFQEVSNRPRLPRRKGRGDVVGTEVELKMGDVSLDYVKIGTDLRWITCASIGK